MDFTFVYILTGTLSGLLLSQAFFYANRLLENSRQVSTSVQTKLKEIDDIMLLKLREMDNKCNSKILEIDQKITRINDLVSYIIDATNSTVIAHNGGRYSSGFTFNNQAKNFLQEKIAKINEKNSEQFKQLLKDISTRVTNEKETSHDITKLHD